MKRTTLALVSVMSLMALTVFGVSGCGSDGDVEVKVGGATENTVIADDENTDCGLDGFDLQRLETAMFALLLTPDFNGLNQRLDLADPLFLFKPFVNVADLLNLGDDDIVNIIDHLQQDEYQIIQLEDMHKFLSDYSLNDSVGISVVAQDMSEDLEILINSSYLSLTRLTYLESKFELLPSTLRNVDEDNSLKYDSFRRQFTTFLRPFEELLDLNSLALIDVSVGDLFEGNGYLRYYGVNNLHELSDRFKLDVFDTASLEDIYLHITRLSQLRRNNTGLDEYNLSDSDELNRLLDDRGDLDNLDDISRLLDELDELDSELINAFSDLRKEYSDFLAFSESILFNFNLLVQSASDFSSLYTTVYDFDLLLEEIYGRLAQCTADTTPSSLVPADDAKKS